MRHFAPALKTKRGRYARRGCRQQGEQPIVVAAAVADPVTIVGEHDAGDQHPVDLVELRTAAAIGTRLCDPVGSPLQVRRRLAHFIELEHLFRFVDQRKQQCLAALDGPVDQLRGAHFAAEARREEDCARIAKSVRCDHRIDNRVRQMANFCIAQRIARGQHFAAQHSLALVQRSYSCIVFHDRHWRMLADATHSRIAYNQLPIFLSPPTIPC